MTLNSSNPFASPIIDAGLLASPTDLAVIVESLKTTRRFLSAPAWKNYIIAPFGTAENLTTDADFETFARANTGTVFHPVGTAAMAPKNAKPGVGVVNSDLTVRGVSGLRVVDASAFPTVPGAFPVCPTFMLGEKAADDILTELREQKSV